MPPQSPCPARSARFPAATCATSQGVCVKRGGAFPTEKPGTAGREDAEEAEVRLLRAPTPAEPCTEPLVDMAHRSDSSSDSRPPPERPQVPPPAAKRSRRS